jgi:hypothetical protein
MAESQGAPSAEGLPELPEPSAHEVHVYGRRERLVTRADAADEMACKYRENDPTATFSGLFTADQMRAYLLADRAARAAQAAEPVAWMSPTNDRDCITAAKKRDMEEFNGSPGKRLAATYSIALYAAPPAPAVAVQPTWIPVSERLPDDPSKVLIWYVPSKNDPHTLLAWFSGREWRFIDSHADTRLPERVTHWQPLPAPPLEPTSATKQEGSET